MALGLVSSDILEVMIMTLGHADGEIRRLACQAVG